MERKYILFLKGPYIHKSNLIHISSYRKYILEFFFDYK